MKNLKQINFSEIQQDQTYIVQRVEDEYQTADESEIYASTGDEIITNLRETYESEYEDVYTILLELENSEISELYRIFELPKF